MWTRKELKEKAKATIKKNYWKVVLVSLLFTILSGGIGAGSSYKKEYSNINTTYNTTQETMDNQINDEIDIIREVPIKTGSMVYLAGFVVGAAVIFVVIFVISIVVCAFIINPLIAGVKRFFSHQLKENTQVREIAFAFDHSYMNVVKTMFFKDLYTILWTLLLIVPGIIKCYEYRMIPYLLGDNPDMSKEEAFAKSKEMMDGQKWNAFVLDLSFIGWNLLSMLTFGILAIFYVAPYVNLTEAALYNRLSGNDTTVYPEYAVEDAQYISNEVL